MNEAVWHLFAYNFFLQSEPLPLPLRDVAASKDGENSQKLQGSGNS